MKTICALVAFAVVAFADAANYCNICSDHTLCTYTRAGPGRTCSNVLGNGLSQQEKDKILAKHNQLREYVAKGNEKRGSPGPQPKATNLGPLTWDNELAEVAQRWAEQCIYGHDSCRDVDRFAVGQNVATYMTTGSLAKYDVTNLVQNWYDEVALFDRRQVSSVSNFNGVGHYTQVVWAETTKLGCGKVEYKERRNGKVWNRVNLVCNYGPAGNWGNSALYKTA